MTPDELLRMIGNHEDAFVERKPDSVATSELRQTVGAFANTVPEGRAAVLFIGIHDKTGDILGVGNPETQSALFFHRIAGNSRLFDFAI